MPDEASAAKVKVLAQLEQDEDGYPPFAVEGLWARRCASGELLLDNIPFFAKGLAPGDALEIEGRGGEVWLKRVATSAGASVFRISASNELEVRRVREELLDLGLPSEMDAKLLLIAVEVPAGADIRPVLSYLIESQERGRFDFEEAALRHQLPD